MAAAVKHLDGASMDSLEANRQKTRRRFPATLRRLHRQVRSGGWRATKWRVRALPRVAALSDGEPAACNAEVDQRDPH